MDKIKGRFENSNVYHLKKAEAYNNSNVVYDNKNEDDSLNNVNSLNSYNITSSKYKEI